jgi:hypothetical protein
VDFSTPFEFRPIDALLLFQSFLIQLPHGRQRQRIHELDDLGHLVWGELFSGEVRNILLEGLFILRPPGIQAIDVPALAEETQGRIQRNNPPRRRELVLYDGTHDREIELRVS